MKKNHYLLIVMLFLSISHVWAWDGVGTQESPYKITTVEELKQLAASVNNGNTYTGTYFELTTDLDLNNEEWIPIGYNGKTFNGIFDGGHHIISNLTITQNAVEGMGFFGKTSNATIRNLGINTATITLASAKNGTLIGASSEGIVQNCFVENSTMTMIGGYTTSKFGIMVGDIFKGNYENCFTANSTIINNAQPASGFAGNIAGAGIPTFTNCIVINFHFTNSLTSGSHGIFCGGIQNNGNKFYFYNCYVENSEYPYIGGTIAISSNHFFYEFGKAIDDPKTTFSKDATFFSTPELSWKLNTTNGTTGNTLIWSHNGTYPIIAGTTNNLATVKAGKSYNGINETQLFANGTTILQAPAEYSYIDCTNGSEITNGQITGITQLDNRLMLLPNSVTSDWNNNVVINGLCESLVLKDGHDFVCPTSFTATKATYTRNCYIDEGWETIVLPFNVTDIKSGGTSVKGDYTVEGYTSTSGTTVKFTELTNITDWKADNAYILKHNSAETGTQECTFEGAGTIAATPTSADFTGTYTLISNNLAADNYALNAAGTEFGPLAASTETATIPAFRAYLKKGNGPSPAKYSVEHDNGATGINNAQQASTIIYADGESIIINSEKAQTINVYSIDGRKAYNTIAEEGTTTINGLPKGIYIVNNQKVILK